MKEARQERIRKVYSSAPHVSMPPSPPPQQHKNGDFVLQCRLSWAMLAALPALFFRSLREMTTEEKTAGLSTNLTEALGSPIHGEAPASGR